MSKPDRAPLFSPPSLSTALGAKDRARKSNLAALSDAGSVASRRNDRSPDIRLERIGIKNIRREGRRTRKSVAAHTHEVAASIDEYGMCVPVIVDQDYNLIDGHTRLEAAIAGGETHIPCIVVSHLSPGEKRKLALSLNRLQEKGVWDLPELKCEIEDLLSEFEGTLDLPGFSDIEIDAILQVDCTHPHEPGPLEPAVDARPTSRLGDIWCLGDHRLTCGDATDPATFVSLIGSDTAVAFLFSDPPYNTKIRKHATRGDHREFAMASGEMSGAQFEAFNRSWLSNCLAYLSDGSVVGAFIDWRGYHQVHAVALQLGLSPINLIVWMKSNAGMGSLYRSQHELLPLYRHGSAPNTNNVLLGKNGRSRSNVWRYPGASSPGSDSRRGLKHHPTVKPVAMIADAILDVTARGDIVLDPFLGSGSTLIACEQTGRRCMGAEIDPLYVDLIIRRYQIVSGRQATLMDTGKTFDALTKSRVLDASDDKGDTQSATEGGSNGG